MGFYPFRGPDASFTRRQSYRMAPRSAKPFPREGGNENLFSFLGSHPSPRPSPRRGERERISNWTTNPGFRLRSTLGYKYFAPSGAGQDGLTIDFWFLAARGEGVNFFAVHPGGASRVTLSSPGYLLTPLTGFCKENLDQEEKDWLRSGEG